MNVLYDMYIHTWLQTSHGKKGCKDVHAVCIRLHRYGPDKTDLQKLLGTILFTSIKCSVAPINRFTIRNSRNFVTIGIGRF